MPGSTKAHTSRIALQDRIDPPGGRHYAAPQPARSRLCSPESLAVIIPEVAGRAPDTHRGVACAKSREAATRPEGNDAGAGLPRTTSIFASPGIYVHQAPAVRRFLSGRCRPSCRCACMELCPHRWWGAARAQPARTGSTSCRRHALSDRGNQWHLHDTNGWGCPECQIGVRLMRYRTCNALARYTRHFEASRKDAEGMIAAASNNCSPAGGSDILEQPLGIPACCRGSPCAMT